MDRGLYPLDLRGIPRGRHIHYGYHGGRLVWWVDDGHQQVQQGLRGGDGGGLLPIGYQVRAGQQGAVGQLEEVSIVSRAQSLPPQLPQGVGATGGRDTEPGPEERGRSNLIANITGAVSRGQSLVRHGQGHHDQHGGAGSHDGREPQLWPHQQEATLTVNPGPPGPDPDRIRRTKSDSEQSVIDVEQHDQPGASRHGGEGQQQVGALQTEEEDGGQSQQKRRKVEMINVGEFLHQEQKRIIFTKNRNFSEKITMRGKERSTMNITTEAVHDDLEFDKNELLMGETQRDIETENEALVAEEIEETELVREKLQEDRSYELYRASRDLRRLGDCCYLQGEQLPVKIALVRVEKTMVYQLTTANMTEKAKLRIKTTKSMMKENTKMK